MTTSVITSATYCLKKDYTRLKNEPVSSVVAEPISANMLEWYFVIIGPENSPYAGGYYLGKMIFTEAYPFEPPIIYMITQNGRFKTNERLGMFVESWSPVWDVSDILDSLLSFMLEELSTEDHEETTDEMKRELAAYSLKTIISFTKFCKLFPELAEKIKKEIEKNCNSCPA